MESALTYEQALAALRWQVEMGITDAIGEEPLDRYALKRHATWGMQALLAMAPMQTGC